MSWFKKKQKSPPLPSSAGTTGGSLLTNGRAKSESRSVKQPSPPPAAHDPGNNIIQQQQSSTSGYSLSREELDRLTTSSYKGVLDNYYLEETLASIGDSQPRVARCTPKTHSGGTPVQTPKGPALTKDGAVPGVPNGETTNGGTAWDMRHCLFGREVYDHMLTDSLAKCDLLQHNLDDYISQVRSGSRSSSSLSGNGDGQHEGTPHLLPASQQPLAVVNGTGAA